MWDTWANTSWIFIFFVFQQPLSQNYYTQNVIIQGAVKDKHVSKTFRFRKHHCIVVKLRQYEQGRLFKRRLAINRL